MQWLNVAAEWIKFGPALFVNLPSSENLLRGNFRKLDFSMGNKMANTTNSDPTFF